MTFPRKQNYDLTILHQHWETFCTLAHWREELTPNRLWMLHHQHESGGGNSSAEFTRNLWRCSEYLVRWSWSANHIHKSLDKKPNEKLGKEGMMGYCWLDDDNQNRFMSFNFQLIGWTIVFILPFVVPYCVPCVLFPYFLSFPGMYFCFLKMFFVVFVFYDSVPGNYYYFFLWGGGVPKCKAVCVYLCFAVLIEL